MKDKLAGYLKYAFIVVCVVELCVEAFEWTGLRHLIKPVLMPLLLVYLRKGTAGSISLSFILAVFALVFSFFGDSFLMYANKGEMYFLLGLGAFATAHLLYIFSFSKAVEPNSQSISIIQKVLYAIPLYGFALGLLWMLWPNIEGFRIPVTIYSTLIMTMVLIAVYRNGRSSTESINQVILGAVFFVLSDTLLALNKFYSPMENSGVFIMGTYMLAQWNIVNGLQKHYNK